MSIDHCKHWSGRDMVLNDKTCKAGVDAVYSFCDGDRTGWVRKVPCIRSNHSDAVCPAAEFRTKQEALQEAKEFEEYMDRFLTMLSKVRPAIEAQHEEIGDWSGTLECPQCAKPLHWSKAKCNGHIHARCETPNCIAWME